MDRAIDKGQNKQNRQKDRLGKLKQKRNNGLARIDRKRKEKWKTKTKIKKRETLQKED